jgi:hypothetical protein
MCTYCLIIRLEGLVGFHGFYSIVFVSAIEVSQESIMNESRNTRRTFVTFSQTCITFARQYSAFVPVSQFARNRMVQRVGETGSSEVKARCGSCRQVQGYPRTVNMLTSYLARLERNNKWREECELNKRGGGGVYRPYSNL